MANMTAREQLMLELINRARLDPKGEAARYNIGLNEGVPGASTISSASKQALAGNDALGLAADLHSNWMIANDVLDHFQNPGPSYSPFNRMNNAGYSFTTAGENIGWVGSTGSLDLTKSIADIHKNLFVDANYLNRG